MNQMTSALMQAGVRTPSVYERIWRYFQDKPRNTSLSCSQVLKLSRANVSSYISEMEVRRMLRSELIDMRVKGAHGAFVTRSVKHYSVNTSDFEMLPRPMMPKTKRKKGSRQVEVSPAPQAAEVKTVNPGIDINSLTLGQARALYDELKKVLG